MKRPLAKTAEKMQRPPARAAEQRKRDTLTRLEADVDAWVATSDVHSDTPCMVPLSYLWDGETFLVATTPTSPAGRNMQRLCPVRLGIGLTRDVVLVEGTVESVVQPGDIPDEVGTEFAAKTGFDPRDEPVPFLYFRIRPFRIQAWREANELAGRDLMRDGTWLV